MTSANKKLGYYDFKHSYQYPMSNATPMEITSSKETKGVHSENKGANVETGKKVHYKYVRQPRVQKKEVQQIQEPETPRKVHKTFFPLEKSTTDTNSS